MWPFSPFEPMRGARADLFGIAFCRSSFECIEHQRHEGHFDRSSLRHGARAERGHDTPIGLGFHDPTYQSIEPKRAHGFTERFGAQHLRVRWQFVWIFRAAPKRFEPPIVDAAALVQELVQRRVSFGSAHVDDASATEHERPVPDFDYAVCTALVEAKKEKCNRTRRWRPEIHGPDCITTCRFAS
jgi:hypothetical protein